MREKGQRHWQRRRGRNGRMAMACKLAPGHSLFVGFLPFTFFLESRCIPVKVDIVFSEELYIIFHMVNSVTYMDIGTSLEKAIKSVNQSLYQTFITIIPVPKLEVNSHFCLFSFFKCSGFYQNPLMGVLANFFPLVPMQS